MPANLAEHEQLYEGVEQAFRDAMLSTNEELHASEIDDGMSGTTAVTCLLRGRTLYIANVGDSRALMAEKGPGDSLIPHPLSRDQTPFRQADSFSHGPLTHHFAAENPAWS